jgi:WhiB family transcriptional regulator, redox-sensing transcriptional regulator
MTMHRTELPLAEPAAGLDWWRDAACQTVDPDLFFPVSSLGPGRDEVARAKAVCASCPVRRQCLQFALATRQAHGVWGGTTEEERRLRVPGQQRKGQPAARRPATGEPANGRPATGEPVKGRPGRGAP